MTKQEYEDAQGILRSHLNKRHSPYNRYRSASYTDGYFDGIEKAMSVLHGIQQGQKRASADKDVEIARLTANGAKLAADLDTATASLAAVQRERDTGLANCKTCSICDWKRRGMRGACTSGRMSLEVLLSQNVNAPTDSGK